MNPHDQVCYLPMIINEEVIGILAVWGPEIREDDIAGLSVFTNQVASAINNITLYQQAQEEIGIRTLAEARIQENLNEKEVLLKEVHHRVKNNLQVITSLLNLQMSQSKDQGLIDGLRESQGRVRAMALIHEKLYQSEDIAKIDFSIYLNSLTNALSSTYRINPEKISIQVIVKDVFLGLDTAIPCGLIVNELVSNSIKYAFPGENTGTISIACNVGKDELLSLIVQDDGIGLPEEKHGSSQNTLGLKLVNSLVKQIDGDLTMVNGKGTKFEINCPLNASEQV